MSTMVTAALAGFVCQQFCRADKKYPQITFCSTGSVFRDAEANG